MVNILHHTAKSPFLDTFFTDTELVIPMNGLPDQQVLPAGDNPAEEIPAEENPAEENLAVVRDEEREADVVQGAELPELHDVPQPAD